MLKIAFRVDVATHIGTGHWQRCLTLANYLTTQHCQVTFLYRDFGGKFNHLFLSDTITFVCIGKGYLDTNSLSSEKDWLGIEELQDSQDFIAAIARNEFDVCVIDHYAISQIWESAVRQYVDTIVVIDDIANRPHDCDVLIDQNFYENYQIRYDKLVNDSTIKLLGPNYTLLRPEFIELRNLPTLPKSDQILVNFGGVGKFDFLSKVLDAIKSVPKYQYIFITGNLSEDEFSLLVDKAEVDYITLMKSTKNMGGLMKESAFALGACGSTVWERFCLGLNAALVAMAENQVESLAYLAEQNLIDNLGSSDEISASFLIDYLENMSIDSIEMLTRKRRIQNLVDGLGVNKIANVILGEINCH